jgi:hypothetical protein
MSRRNKDKGRIGGPFVPMLTETMKSAAWRAMSPHARIVYIALKSHYGFEARNNGRIYLPARTGAEETGLDRTRIARSLRELQHYGFIVMTEAGCLGLNGRGRAPHWRLTELGYMHDPPTKDFLKWDGELFHEQKSPAYYKRRDRHLAKLEVAKKQNPVRASLTDCQSVTDIPVSERHRHLPNNLSERHRHINGVARQSVTDISRVNHSAVLTDAPASVVFQPPAVRPDSGAVADYLAAWMTNESAFG